MIVMFAVLVPIFLAMLAFVIDVGQMYLENRNAQQLADSVARTVDKILSKGMSSGVLIAESDIPSSAKPYLSYDELKTAYPDAADTLKDLKTALDVFSTTNITITQQYGVDTDQNLYCLLTVSKSYKTIMKIASAAEGEGSSGGSSGDSTATGSLVLKFDKADNKVTGSGYNPAASNLEELTEQLSGATPEEEQEIIQSLVTTTTEEKTAAISTLNTILGASSNDTQSDSAKSKVARALLAASSETFSDAEKGAIFDAYLSSYLYETQLNDDNSTTLKTTQIARKPDITQAAARSILVLTLNTLTNVSNVVPDISGDDYIITYEDSNTSNRYHKVVIKTKEVAGETVNIVNNYTQADPF